MNQNYLPQRWQGKLQNYLSEIGSKYANLAADEFQHTLKFEFGDGSNAQFRHAFYWTDKAINEIAVFTEHCGYHIFPLFDSKVEAFGASGISVKFEDFTEN